MSRVALSLVVLFAVIVLPAAAEEEVEKRPVDPVHHALVQKKVGFYAVYLPPDYADEASAKKTWPVCVILHGHGSSETGHGGLSNTFGRKGVIYVAPRAGHAHEEQFLENKTRGWTAWPVCPPAWGEWGSPDFQKDKLKGIEIDRLFTDFIADCVLDVRKRYRTDGKRVVVVGHSMGGAFAHKFAIHRPELVRAYFAYAGFYGDTTKDEIAALTLKKHEIFPVIAHCSGDTVVSVDEARGLVDYLSEHDVPYYQILQPDGSHSFTSTISRAAQEFVAEYCRGEKLPPLKGELTVTEIVPDSQASKIGLRKDDVITSYAGKPIRNSDHLRAAIAGVAEGTESIEIVWKRGEETMKATIEPGKIGVMLADR